MANTRKASHAGSWYVSSPKELDKQLGNWLNNAELSHGPARAIISPHAGYRYCGECAAFAYRQISPASVQRIFILGPSHYYQLGGCALSGAKKYSTPLYDLKIDSQIYSELEATNKFETISMDVDEEEHSLEMQIPYIAKVMEDFKNEFTIVPVMVGSLSTGREAEYGRIFAPYLADPRNLFVISSDFCHWGDRFRFTYYDSAYGEIHQSIEALDRKGMDTIETLNPSAFTEYLEQYGNTICGRHPIGVLLQAVKHLQTNAVSNGHKLNMKFLKYAQSQRITHKNDSSVSYAAAALVME
ncbi:protein MEMO1 isoform X2 [Diaphorina citri]|uniref:Protein MEMO1 isoform X1 n=1 Tax=Diaphorina citri TaxID=121845 RepID=A0A1S3DH04_DIACI|nr:protein MEMO1 isoform X1 [Diaphorina citri]XP_017303312.1 protein MEMO1 isoform X2 [Diaphorina citri]